VCGCVCVWEREREREWERERVLKFKLIWNKKVKIKMGNRQQKKHGEDLHALYKF
jgi:hypothetical protein